ncbi:MAG: DUF1566 domain-containing protein [Alphaproteobacteria bacterium]|nr:DUF1566 domain-containing protein [Alphaproteobacteria bacterium]
MAAFFPLSLSLRGPTRRWELPVQGFLWGQAVSSRMRTGTASSCRTGEANTTYLVWLSDTASPYEAALYCYCLGKPATGTCSSDPTGGADGYGYSDWYLPAQDEIDVMYDNKTSIGGFNTTGFPPAGNYWSSSEVSSMAAKHQPFSSGLQSGSPKSNAASVRCVRR